MSQGRTSGGSPSTGWTGKQAKTAPSLLLGKGLPSDGKTGELQSPHGPLTQEPSGPAANPAPGPSVGSHRPLLPCRPSPLSPHLSTLTGAHAHAHMHTRTCSRSPTPPCPLSAKNQKPTHSGPISPARGGSVGCSPGTVGQKGCRQEGIPGGQGGLRTGRPAPAFALWASWTPVREVSKTQTLAMWLRSVARHCLSGSSCLGRHPWPSHAMRVHSIDVPGRLVLTRVRQLRSDPHRTSRQCGLGQCAEAGVIRTSPAVSSVLRFLGVRLPSHSMLPVLLTAQFSEPQRAMKPL